MSTEYGQTWTNLPAELMLESRFDCIDSGHSAVLRPAPCRATIRYSAESRPHAERLDEPGRFESRSSPRRWASSAARPCRPIGCCEPGRAIRTSTRGWCRSTRSRPVPSAVRVEIKYLRTVATQLCYWPLLFRELRHGRRRPRVLGVVLLVPARAAAGGADREAARQAGRDELPERRGARPPAALGDRARDAAQGRAERRPVAVPPGRVRRTRHRRRGHPEHRRRRSLPVSAARAARGRRILSTRNFEALYNVSCTLRAFRLVQDRYPEATLTLVGAGSEDAATAGAGRASCGSRTSRSPAAWRPTTSGATTPTPTSICRRRTSTTCRRRCSRRSRAAARWSPPTPAASRRS